MNLPLTLPSWLPWWVPIAVLVPLSLYALVFLLMPFSVIGVKARLDVIEARLDEMQGEIRNLVLRLPAIELGAQDRLPPARGSGRERPPIAPAPTRSGSPEGYDDQGEDSEEPAPRAVRAPVRPPPIPEDPRRRRPPTREEPRLDWRG